MSTYLAGLVTQTTIACAKTVVSYGAKAIGGHVSVQALNNIKTGIEESGKELAGPVGKTVGNFIGRAVAGHALEAVQQEGSMVASAINTLGQQAVDAIATAHQDPKINTIQEKEWNKDLALDQTEIDLQSNDIKDDTEKQKKTETSSYVETIGKTLKLVGTVGGGIAVLSGAAVPVSLAFVAVNSAPKIFDAAVNKIDTQAEKVNLINDVVVPVMTQTAIQSAGVLVEGVVRYDTIQSAYQSTIQHGERLGKALGFFMPKKVQDAFGQVGRLVGYIDAGRYAMSEEVVQQAVSKGSLAKNVTEAGLQTIDIALKLKNSGNSVSNNKEENSYWDTAKNVGVISMGIIGGAVLITVAPEAAALAGGAAVLNVADKAVKWIRLKMIPESEIKEQKLPEIEVKETLENNVNIQTS